MSKKEVKTESDRQASPEDEEAERKEQLNRYRVTPVSTLETVKVNYQETIRNVEGTGRLVESGRLLSDEKKMKIIRNASDSIELINQVLQERNQ